jgi:hypothetical protein
LNNDKVTIGGEKYSASDIELITGGEGGEPLESILLLARVLEDPLRLPRMIKQFCTLCLQGSEMEEFRLALIRVQIDADLKMHQDIQRYQQRRYVSQVIEILLFQELTLAPSERVADEEGVE